MEKGEYRPSALQLSIWDAWLEYWQLVADYKERLQAKVYALCLGDLGDLNKHSDAELVSKVDADVERAMLDVTKPIEHIPDLWFIVRGTEAHSKSAGLLEEWFAGDRTNAVHCPLGTASWEAWEGKIEGVHIYGAHHLPSGTKLAGNRGNAVANSCRYLSNECIENGYDIPELAFWGHRHWYAKGYNLQVNGYAVPSWKGLGSFARRIGVGRPSPVGGLICIIPGTNGERWEVKKPFLRRPPVLPIWTPDSTETSTSTPRSSSRKSKSGKRRGLLSRLGRSRGDNS